MLRARTHIKPYTVVQARGHDLYCRKVFHVSAMHLGRYVADAALDVPDTLTCTPTTTEETDITGIRLRVIGTYESKQRRLAATITPMQCPALTAPDLPAQMFKNRMRAIAQRNIMQGDDREVCKFISLTVR